MLKLENVHVTFNPNTPSQVHALCGVTFSTQVGDFVTVIGANGAGKSTLFNVIAGTVSTDKGKIWLHDNEISKWSEPRRAANIGRVFQNPLMGTCPGLSVRENLALAAKRGQRRGLGLGVKRRYEEWFYETLKDIGLGLEDRMDSDVALLSGGQRQAVTLIMATLNQPELLLLDEHTAALDPNAAAQVIELTVRLAKEHRLTVIMITHSMHQAVEIGTHVVMMNRGRVLFEIADEERQNLTVDNLVSRFRALNTQSELSDRTLLE